MEFIVKVDARGYIMIPSEIRKKLGIENVARLRIEGDKIVIERIRDPLEFLEVSTISGTNDIEIEIAVLRKSVDDDLRKEV